MGADHVINTGSGDKDIFKKHAFELDAIVSTVDVAHGLPLTDLLPCLAVHGKFISVGLPDEPLEGIQPQVSSLCPRIAAT